MEEDFQEQDVQLNKDAPEQEVYSLEDIMREFGGWTKTEQPPEAEQEEKKPAREPEIPQEPEPEEPSGAHPQPENRQDTEAPSLIRVAADEPQKKSKFKLVDMSGDTVRFKPVTEEVLESQPAPRKKTLEMPEEPAQEADSERERRKARKREEKRLRRLNNQRKKAMRAQRRAQKQTQPEVVYPSPEEACAAYAKGCSLRLRTLLTFLLTIASCTLLVLSSYPIGSLDLTGSQKSLAVGMLALLLVQSVLSMDILAKGIYQVLKLRFDLLSLMVLSLLITVADAFFAIPEGRVPTCATVSLAMTLAMQSVSLTNKAKWRTLKTVLSMENPVAAVKQEKAWHDLDCIFRRPGSLEDFTAMLETPDAAQKVMRVYAPIAAILTAALAVFSAWHGNGEFLWAWSSLLTAALPAGGFLACCRPFERLAGRLSKLGAAICGWQGARILSGECGIMIEDGDLFPAGNIALNGIKMYSELPVRQVVGYATAVVQAAGSGLLPLFEEVMKNENGRRYTVDTFRQYEGGGLGAEICGDVVLLGSLAFMRLMGVPVPESVQVQSAVYISVNKELTGIFALSYAPSASTRSGLHHVLRSTGLTPVLATRDFMITPGLVKKRYKIPADRLEFPVVAERAQLSAEDAGKDGRQGALMTKGSFISFAAAVTGGRQLRRTVHLAVFVALLSGWIGMILLFVLTYLDAVTAASAMNLLLYQLLWMVPAILITGMVGKSS